MLYGAVLVDVTGNAKGGQVAHFVGAGNRSAEHQNGQPAIGEAAERVEQALGSVVPVAHAAGLAEAVRQAAAMAAGGVVLLAPACSSFDMFRDYAERGDAFKREVWELAREERD